MRILKNIRIDEISVVLKGANPGAEVMIRKADDDPPYLFDDIMLAKVADDDEPDEAPLSAQLDEIVAEMIAARPSLHPNRARRWLLHTPAGRELLSQQKKEPAMPQADILKAATIMEEALMAQVKQSDGETYAKAFSRRYENDLEFRKQWATVSEAKQLMALKGMATLTPTSTGVGNTNVSDDSAEAVRLLGEMAAKNGRSFESVFSDPANAKLASRTYTANHRSSVNMDYLEQ